jgi:hypothetical protein
MRIAGKWKSDGFQRRIRVIALPDPRAHIAKMTKRATQRPSEFVKPAHWTNAPAPKPQAPAATEDPQELSPTRYGDWVRNGIAVDF